MLRRTGIVTCPSMDPGTATLFHVTPLCQQTQKSFLTELGDTGFLLYLSVCFFFFGCHDQQAGEAFWLLIARLTIENHLMPVTEWHSHCQVRLVGSHRKCGQCYTGNLLTRNTARLGDLYSGTQESRCNKTNTYPTLDTFSFI